MSLNVEIKRIAAQISGKLTNLRRDLHAYPELGFEEKRTCEKITGALRSIGLDKVRSPVARTGVVGLLAGAKGKGKTAALRADIDALPIPEKSAVPYKSRNPGVMHACGHEAHVAMCLGAAMILKRCQAEIKGQVKFIFQPAEERLDGARTMISAGCLENPKVDAIFALHVNPELDFGTVGCTAGPVFAAPDRFKIQITGRGGHGAVHSKCIDPILVANEIYGGLQSIERKLDGAAARVISVCSIHGGEAFNIIPDSVIMEGTVRTFDKRVQATIIRRMREITAGISSAHGAKWKITYDKGVPATINDIRMDRLCRQAARELGMPCVTARPSMIGDDFSCYQQSAPGVLERIGIRTGKNFPALHNNRFDAGDRILPFGAALLAKCALLVLETR